MSNVRHNKATVSSLQVFAHLTQNLPGPTEIAQKTPESLVIGMAETQTGTRESQSENIHR